MQLAGRTSCLAKGFFLFHDRQWSSFEPLVWPVVFCIQKGRPLQCKGRPFVRRARLISSFPARASRPAPSGPGRPFSLLLPSLRPGPLFWPGPLFSRARLFRRLASLRAQPFCGGNGARRAASAAEISGYLLHALHLLHMEGAAGIAVAAADTRRGRRAQVCIVVSCQGIPGAGIPNPFNCDRGTCPCGSRLY